MDEGPGPFGPFRPISAHLGPLWPTLGPFRTILSGPRKFVPLLLRRPAALSQQIPFLFGVRRLVAAFRAAEQGAGK